MPNLVQHIPQFHNLIDLTDTSQSRPRQPVSNPQYSQISTQQSAQIVPSTQPVAPMSQYQHIGFDMPNAHLRIQMQTQGQTQQVQQVQHVQPYSNGMSQEECHQLQQMRRQSEARDALMMGNGREGPIYNVPNHAQQAQAMNMRMGMAGGPRMGAQRQSINVGMTMNMVPQQLPAQFFNGNMSAPMPNQLDQLNFGQFSSMPQTQVQRQCSVSSTPMQAQAPYINNTQIQRQADARNVFANMTPQEQHRAVIQDRQQQAYRKAEQDVLSQHEQFNMLQQQAVSQPRTNQIENPLPTLTSGSAQPQPGQKRQLNTPTGPAVKRQLAQRPPLNTFLPSNGPAQQQQKVRRHPHTPGPAAESPVNRNPHTPPTRQNVQNIQINQNTHNTPRQQDTSQQRNLQHQQMAMPQQSLAQRQQHQRAMIMSRLPGLEAALSRMQVAMSSSEVQQWPDQDKKNLQVQCHAHRLIWQRRQSYNMETQSPATDEEWSIIRPTVRAQLQEHIEKVQLQAQLTLSHMGQTGINSNVDAQILPPCSEEQLRQQQMLSQQTQQQQQQVQQQYIQHQQGGQQHFHQVPNQQQPVGLQQHTEQQPQRTQQTSANSGPYRVSVEPLDPTVKVELDHYKSKMQQGQGNQRDEALFSAPSKPSSPSLHQNRSSSGSPHIQQSIERSPSMDEMSEDEQLMVRLIEAEIQKPASSSSTQYPSSSPAVSAQRLRHNVNSPLSQEAIISSPATTMSSSNSVANHEVSQPSYQSPPNGQFAASLQQFNSPDQQYANIPPASTSESDISLYQEQPAHQQKQQIIEIFPIIAHSPDKTAAQVSHAPSPQLVGTACTSSTSASQERLPFGSRTTPIVPPNQQTATPLHLTSQTKQAPQTPEAVYNPTITSEGHRFGFVDSGFVVNPGADWTPLECKDTGFGLFSPRGSPTMSKAPFTLSPDFSPLAMQKMEANVKWAFNHPDVARKIETEGLQDKALLRQFYALGKPSITNQGVGQQVLESVHEALQVEEATGNSQRQSFLSAGNNWDDMANLPMFSKSKAQQEEEAGEEGTEQPPTGLVLNTGPFTSKQDAVNHHINKQFGTGWEMHADDNLIPDRELGVVEEEVWQKIQNGEAVQDTWTWDELLVDKDD